MRSIQDTIAAIATPLGESGIGVIRLSGSSSIAIISSIFKPAKSISLDNVPSHTCYFGNLIFKTPSSPVPFSLKYGEGELEPLSLLKGEGERSSGEGVIDQVVVTVFRTPHSYTGEDVVEIS